MTDTPDTPDPADDLRAQLAVAHQRLIQAELRSQAIRAGIIDLDGLKLLDTSALVLAEDGSVPNAADAMAALRRDKPWMFAQPNSSHPAPPPAAPPPKPRNAKDMSYDEWQAARARLLRAR